MTLKTIRVAEITRVTNVRVGPGIGHPIITQFPAGEKIEVVYQTSQWSALRMGDGYAWVYRLNTRDWHEEKPSSEFKFTHHPLQGVWYVQTQPYGARPEVYKKYNLPGHEGVDFAANWGSDVCAVADGTISRVEFDGRPKYMGGNSNYGRHVRIDHGNDYFTIYAHLSQIFVTKDQLVTGGQVIGTVGNTGNVWPKPKNENDKAGTHLHFTMKDKSKRQVYPYNIIDPTPFLEAVS